MPRAKKTTDKASDIPLRKKDLVPEGEGGNKHRGKVLRAEIVTRTGKTGRDYRAGEVDVDFDFCEKWPNPKRTADGTAYKTNMYPVSRADNSDWGELIACLEDMGWELADFSELEGCTFMWQAQNRGTYTGGDGKEHDRLVWFPVELVEE